MLATSLIITFALVGAAEPPATDPPTETPQGETQPAESEVVSDGVEAPIQEPIQNETPPVDAVAEDAPLNAERLEQVPTVLPEEALQEARTSYAAQRYDEARVHLGMARQHQPDDDVYQAQVNLLNGRIHVAEGQIQEALLAFVQAAWLDETILGLFVQEPDGYIACANSIVLAGDDRESIRQRIATVDVRAVFECPAPVAPAQDQEMQLIADQRPGPAVHIWRWTWIGAGLATLAAGVAMEATREQPMAGMSFSTADFAGPGLMVFGAGSILMGWLGNPFDDEEKDGSTEPVTEEDGIQRPQPEELEAAPEGQKVSGPPAAPSEVDAQAPAENQEAESPAPIEAEAEPSETEPQEDVAPTETEPAATPQDAEAKVPAPTEEAAPTEDAPPTEDGVSAEDSPAEEP